MMIVPRRVSPGGNWALNGQPGVSCSVKKHYLHLPRTISRYPFIINTPAIPEFLRRDEFEVLVYQWVLKQKLDAFEGGRGNRERWEIA